MGGWVVVVVVVVTVGVWGCRNTPKCAGGERGGWGRPAAHGTPCRLEGGTDRSPSYRIDVT